MILLAFTSCGKKGDANGNGTGTETKKFDSPEKYNDFIVGLSDNVGREIAILSITIWSPGVTATDLDSGLIRLKAECDKSLGEVGKLDGYDGNTELRDGMKDLLTYYSGLTNKEFPNLITYAKNGFQETADSSKVQEIFDDMDRRESAIIEKLGKVQEAFAQKYGITLEDKGAPMDPNEFIKE